MEINTKKCTGALKVSENVIVDIAANVIRETQGASEYKISNPLDFGKNLSVSVIFNNGAAEITAFVSLAFGSKVQACAEAIQKKIKSCVQDMTGVMVSKVNVKVMSII